MKKVMMWIAEDGVEFESEWDCHQYEMQKNLDKMGGCKAYNESGELLDLDDCEKTFFIHFDSLPQIELYGELTREQGLCSVVGENGCDAAAPLNFLYLDECEVPVEEGWIQFSQLRHFYEQKIQALDEMEQDLFGVAAE